MIKLLSTLLMLLSIHTLSAQKTVTWAEGGGSASDDEAFCVVTDHEGNTVITGYFTGTATFGTTTLTSVGGADMFVAKYDPTGTLLWVEQAGDASDQGGHMLHIDGQGNIYVAGKFEGSITFGGTTHNSSGQHDIVLVKYDPTGSVLWSLKGGSAGIVEATSLQTDATGDVYMVGSFEGTLQLGTRSATSGGSFDMFVAKVTSAGIVDWLTSGGGPTQVKGRGIALDPFGNIGITGNFDGSANFGIFNLTAAGGNRSMFTLKLGPGGNIMWARDAGGTDFDSVYEMTADDDGNFYIAGFISGTATFGNDSITSAGDNDAYVAKLSPGGVFQWAVRAGGTMQARAYAVHWSAAGEVCFTGSYAGTATFGTDTYTSAGDQDIFIACVDTGGNFGYTMTAGGPGFDRAYGLYNDAAGNIWITGIFEQMATFGTHTLTSAGQRDFFVARSGQPVGTGPLHSPGPLQTWPNPTTGLLNVRLPSDFTTPTPVALLDITGRTLLTGMAMPGTPLQLSLEALPSGLYFLHLPGTTGTSVKVVKM